MDKKLKEDSGQKECIVKFKKKSGDEMKIVSKSDFKTKLEVVDFTKYYSIRTGKDKRGIVTYSRGKIARNSKSVLKARKENRTPIKPIFCPTPVKKRKNDARGSEVIDETNDQLASETEKDVEFDSDKSFEDDDVMEFEKRKQKVSNFETKTSSASTSKGSLNLEPVRKPSLVVKENQTKLLDKVSYLQTKKNIRQNNSGEIHVSSDEVIEIQDLVTTDENPKSPATDELIETNETEVFNQKFTKSNTKAATEILKLMLEKSEYYFLSEKELQILTIIRLDELIKINKSNNKDLSVGQKSLNINHTEKQIEINEVHSNMIHIGCGLWIPKTDYEICKSMAQRNPVSFIKLLVSKILGLEKMASMTYSRAAGKKTNLPENIKAAIKASYHHYMTNILKLDADKVKCYESNLSKDLASKFCHAEKCYSTLTNEEKKELLMPTIIEADSISILQHKINTYQEAVIGNEEAKE